MTIATVAKQIGTKPPVLFERVLLYPGTFNPWCEHHRTCVNALVKIKERREAVEPVVPVSVVVWPVGDYGKGGELAPPQARKDMLYAGLSDLIEAKKVVLETHDLDYAYAGYTPTAEMQARLAARPRTALHEEFYTVRAMPTVIVQVWHVLGADNVPNITGWEDGSALWKHGRFIILSREGTVSAELPPHHTLLDLKMKGNASDVRKNIRSGKPWEHLVPKGVAVCIKRRGLYGFQSH